MFPHSLPLSRRATLDFMFLFVILKERLVMFLHFLGGQRILVNSTPFLFSLDIFILAWSSLGKLVARTGALHGMELNH